MIDLRGLWAPSTPLSIAAYKSYYFRENAYYIDHRKGARLGKI
jgi:hypothetical protein